MSLLLIRLQDCATSSRLGMADKMFPKAMGELAARGYVAPAPGGGYKITDAGLGYLKSVHYQEKLAAYQHHGRRGLPDGL